jgi:hypothetical protein
MAAYRFRIVAEADPMALWRDVVIGGDRTLADLQREINVAVGLPQYHLWFFGIGDAYWNSQVKYLRPDEYQRSDPSDPVTAGEMTYDAGETTIDAVVADLELSIDDFFCYLYDYSNEWRFSLILRERRDEAAADIPAQVVDGEGSIDDLPSRGKAATSFGEPIDQADASFPDPIEELLPDAVVYVSDLRELERRDDVAHVLILLPIETDEGLLCERFGIQFDDQAYLLEKFPYGWEVMHRIEGPNRSERELLTALADGIRDWHDEIAAMAGQASGRALDARSLNEMNAQLEAELERKGYTEL